MAKFKWSEKSNKNNTTFIQKLTKFCTRNPFEIISIFVLTIVQEKIQEVNDEEPVTEAFDEPVTEPVEEPVDEPVDVSVTESVEEPVTKPVDELVTEPVDEPVEEQKVEETPIVENSEVTESYAFSEAADDAAAELTENVIAEVVEDAEISNAAEELSGNAITEVTNSSQEIEEPGININNYI